jgi:pimeloyl-ACP methyl ester carboxylesterase
MTQAADKDELDFAVAVDGIELRCTAVGQGPAVVLLHAGGERRRVWRPVAKQLCTRGFRAVSVDQRGHGETGGAIGACLDPYAADIRALLDALNVPVVLVGASLGGLASLLAMTDPATSSRVTGVVLVDVVPDPNPVENGFYQRLESGGAAPTAPYRYLPLIEDILGRAEELRRAAAELRVPVCLVRGSAGYVDSAVVEGFVQLVPSATVRIVQGAGHLVARERPHELANVLLDILEQPARSAAFCSP